MMLAQPVAAHCIITAPVRKLNRKTPERRSATFLNTLPALRADTAVFLLQNAPFQAKINNQKMLPPGAIFKLKIHQNAFTAGL